MTDGTRAPATACSKPSRRTPGSRTGTTAGYLAHVRAGEVACDPCKAAQAAKTAVRRGHDADEYAAYRRALADYQAKVSAGEPVPVCAKPSTEHPGGRTGTSLGYLAHYYAGEPSCDPCQVGHSVDQAQRKIDDPDRFLRSNLWTHYRLRLERYYEILREQGGQCAICRAEHPGDIRLGRFHVDHDHACCPGFGSCGKCVRGLLCRGCNTALGNFRDDPDVLLAALSYLLSYGKEVAC